MVIVPGTKPVHWPTCYRIIPTKYPRINIFEDVADPSELDTILAIYAFGNDRIREELNLLHRVPQADRVSGPGASYIMAAFTHINPRGSRFSDGSYGVFYASNALRVSIAETQYHLAQFYSATAEPPAELDQRVLEVMLRAELHDLRGRRKQFARAYSPTSYRASQRLGVHLHSINSWGVAYDSVRTKGECAGVFRPPALSNCRESSVLTYIWDGTKFAGEYEKRPLRGGRFDLGR
ncbi:MAG TPA: RES family NAD+ phosphorylase [Candidatus Acidoferrales bacterium]|nr:RES family NAD+ phosphorylase [Candidatus Acidoferrales bacterium]